MRVALHGSPAVGDRNVAIQQDVVPFSPGDPECLFRCLCSCLRCDCSDRAVAIPVPLLLRLPLCSCYCCCCPFALCSHSSPVHPSSHIGIQVIEISLSFVPLSSSQVYSCSCCKRVRERERERMEERRRQTWRQERQARQQQQDKRREGEACVSSLLPLLLCSLSLFLVDSLPLFALLSSKGKTIR